MNKEKLSIVKTKYAINGTTTYCEITFKFRAMPFIVASLYYACRIVFSQQPIDIKNIFLL